MKYQMLTKSIKNTKPIHLMPYFGNFFVVNVIFWIIKAQDWWRFWGFVPMKPDFADIRAYTAQVTCAQNGTNYLIENCDPWGREIGALNMFVPILKFFNLNEARTSIIGYSFQIILFISIYAVAYALRLNLGKLKNAVLVILILVSPPIAIAIERGQLEIIVFVFIVFAVFLLHANRAYSAWAILGFVSILKMYPIILLVLLLANRSLRKTKPQLFFGLFVFIASIFLIFLQVWDQRGSTQVDSLSVGFWRTFGITVLPYLGVKAINDLQLLDSNLFINLLQAHFIGTTLIIVFIIMLFYAQSKGRVFGPNLTPLFEERTLRSLFLLSSLYMLAVCYFIISSFDYRMIYALPLFLIGLAQDSSQKKNRLTIYLVYGILFAMWSQVFIWTSALAQIPILISCVLILFNIRTRLLVDYLSTKWLKRLQILRF